MKFFAILKLVIAAGLVCTAPALAQGEDDTETTTTRVYNFTDHGDGGLADRCCSAWMYYTDLEPEGMVIGDVTLGMEDKAFFHLAKKGESFTSLATSVKAKSSGMLDFKYVFHCDKENNPECPNGNITIPFSMTITCGETKKTEFVEEYPWIELGVSLALMITNRPDKSKALTGEAHVTPREMTPCL